MSMRKKLFFLNLIIGLFVLVSLFASHELSRGTYLVELNLNHTRYNHVFFNDVLRYEQGKLQDLPRLRAGIMDVRRQPVDCLRSINFIEKWFIEALGTQAILSICEKDIREADRTLNSIELYSKGEIDKQALIASLRRAVSDFAKNSDDFEPLVDQTVRAIYLLMTGLIILLGATIFLLVFFITRAIQGDYETMKGMSDKIQKLATFPAKNPNPIIEINEELEATYTNSAFRCAFPNIALDKRFGEMIPKRFLNNIKWSFANQKSCDFDEFIEGRWMAFAIDYIQFGDEKYVRVFCHDVTERKEAEQRIHDSEERYEIAVKGSSVGLWDWNIKTGELFWSNRFKEIVGIVEEDFHPRFDEFSGRLHPDDKEAILAEFFGHIEKHTPYDVEYRLRHNDGHYIWIHARGQAVWDHEGKATRFAGSVDDVTLQKQAEQQLLEVNAELEEFAYRTSHDLRSPIVSSIALLELAENMIVTDKAEAAAKGISHAHASLERLKVLIDDILQITVARSKEEKEERVDVPTIVSECLDKFSHLEGIEGITIEQNHQADMCLTIKPLRFTMIVENLLSNAIKYRDPEQEGPFIRIESFFEDGAFLLKIQDNGLGVPKEQQKHLFKMFKRFHPKVAFGSGLGLYLMRKSADALGASIMFSDPGKGALFILRIPLGGEKHVV